MGKLRELIEEKKQKYDKIIKSAVSEKVAKKFIREKKRWLCRNDLFYLCCLTGNSKIEQWKDFYQPFCDEVSLMNWTITQIGMHKSSEDMLEWQNFERELVLQRLFLCYRTFYKTTIVTKVHSLQLLLNFPDIRIVLAHNKQENASDTLVTIKNYFLTTPLKQIFSECVPDTKEWGNMSGFSLANRTDWGRDEASIEAVGVDTEVTGRHWQVAKKDDLVTEKSVTTEEQRLKSFDWDNRFNIGQFDDIKAPVQDYSGTRYHHVDMYSIKRNDQRIKLVEFPIVNDMEKFKEGDDTQIVHPDRFSRDDINKLMEDMWVFNCQMMLRPDDPAKMSFRQEMIQYYDGLPEGLNFYLVVDPASKRKKKSDYTAMMVVGIDHEGNRYIADMLRDKLNPDGRIKMAIEFARKWGIKESGWEESGLGDDNFYLEEMRRKERLFFTVTPIKTMPIAKEDKIRNILVPEYASHKWFWPAKGKMVKYSEFHGKNFDLTEALESEFMQFPLGEHDDLMDCQTFLAQMNLIKPKKEEVNPIRGMTFKDYMSMGEERRSYERNHPWERLKVLERV